MSRTPTGDAHGEAAAEFVRRVRSEGIDEVSTVRLYGSVARGDQTDGSDVDLLVTLERAEGREAVEERLRTIAYDVSLEHGVALSLLVETDAEFEAEADRRFHRRVSEESEVLYG